MPEPSRRQGRIAAAACASFAILALSLAAGLDAGRLAWGTGDWFGRFSPGGAAAFALFALGVGILNLAVLVGLWMPEGLSAALGRLSLRFSWLSPLRRPVVLLLILLPAALVYYTPFGELFPGVSVRVLLLVACAGLSGVLSGGAKPLRSFPALALGMGAALVLAREFSSVTGYPFSLSWSEGNRLWDYSLAFGRDRYVLPEGGGTFAYISPGRQALWGLVYLVPGATILLARLWNAILFTLPYAALGWVAMRTEARSRGYAWKLGFAAWSLVFLAQGPIYTPLVLSAIVVALAVRLRPSWIVAVLVGLASYYAYDSRWTWLLAPGAWAVLVTVLEAPLVVDGRWRVDRLRRAAALGFGGVLGGYVAPTAVAWLTRGAGPAGVADVGGALTRQPLLWYRLLPNPTYGPGVLLALLLVAAPTLAVLVWLLRRRAWTLDRWQLAALLALLAALLVAGVIVSAKIGGGSNLHNLDMFLITLLFAVAAAFKGTAEAGRIPTLLENPSGRWLAGLALALPMALTISTGGPLHLPDPTAIAESLAVIRSEVAAAIPRGEVLFYDQRQLLTFGFVEDVPLVADYEKKYMADQALSGDPAFFQPFYDDLSRQRFSLIVSPPLETTWQEDHPFSEEDEAQVRFLYLPMAEYYEPVVRLDAVGVWLLRPRQASAP